MKGEITMKKSIILMIALLLISLLMFTGCSEEQTTDDTPTQEVTQADEITLSEEEATAIALENAGIQQTAANNLTVTADALDGVDVYVVAFDWSGFDYQYTINAATGEIIETLFDGEVL